MDLIYLENNKVCCQGVVIGTIQTSCHNYPCFHPNKNTLKGLGLINLTRLIAFMTELAHKDK